MSQAKLKTLIVFDGLEFKDRAKLEAHCENMLWAVIEALGIHSSVKLEAFLTLLEHSDQIVTALTATHAYDSTLDGENSAPRVMRAIKIKGENRP